jgi:hypothetical protein
MKNFKKTLMVQEHNSPVPQKETILQRLLRNQDSDSEDSIGPDPRNFNQTQIQNGFAQVPGWPAEPPKPKTVVETKGRRQSFNLRQSIEKEKEYGPTSHFQDISQLVGLPAPMDGPVTVPGLFMTSNHERSATENQSCLSKISSRQPSAPLREGSVPSQENNKPSNFSGLKNLPGTQRLKGTVITVMEHNASSRNIQKMPLPRPSVQETLGLALESEVKTILQMDKDKLVFENF